MTFNIKKYGIIVIIAILFAVLSFSIVDVINENPKYEDYCVTGEYFGRFDLNTNNCPKITEPSSEEIKSCSDAKGTIEYNYDGNGCAVSYKCEKCNNLYDEAVEQHGFIRFIITSIFGVIAVLIGLYIKTKDDIIEWIYSGFLVGGILSILFGTVSYFGDMGRFVKPIILLVEIGLIILIALKTIKNK